MKVTVQENNDIHCVRFRLDIISDNPEETFFPAHRAHVMIEKSMDGISHDFGEGLIGINRHFVHSIPSDSIPSGLYGKVSFIIEVTNYKTDEWLPTEENIKNVLSDTIDYSNKFIVTEIFRTISKKEMRDIKLNEILRKDIIN